MSTAIDLRLTPEQSAIVAENLGLCGWAVKRWGRHLPPAGGAGYTQEDAYQDAVFGLMRAVQLHDPDKGTLGTYAARKMQKAITIGIGTHDGIDRRRSIRAHDLAKAPAPYSAPLSLDVKIGDPDGRAFLDLLADPTDHDGIIEDRVALAEIRAVRDRVCRDLMDCDLFDAMTDTRNPYGKTRTCTLIGERHGMTREAGRRRWVRMERRIRELTGRVSA